MNCWLIRVADKTTLHLQLGMILALQSGIKFDDLKSNSEFRNPHKKYSVKYCAHQVNGKLGRQQQKFDKDELSDDSDFEHDLAEEENEEEEGIEDEQPNSLLINA